MKKIVWTIFIWMIAVSVGHAADFTWNLGSPDILTYGLSAGTNLGNSPIISSLMYVPTAHRSNSLAFSSKPLITSDNSLTSNALRRDRIVVQNANLGVGKVRLKLGYQDLGDGFVGFASLKDSKAASDDVLNQLEKEKGIKRTVIGTSIATGTASGLNFSREQIAEKKDNILSQSFGYSSEDFIFGFNTRQVGKNFSRFTDLREADRDQMALEAGINRVGYATKFKTGSVGNAPTWSNFSTTTIQSETGNLNYKSADLDLGPIKVQAGVRTMDSGFGKMTALNDSERSQMALIARRQFTPKSQAAEVTADDKIRIFNEAGINRESLNAQFAAGPVSLSLATSSTNAGDSALSRQGFTLEHKTFSMYFNHHKIDQSFNRLPYMQLTEQLQFGNETGMTRTEMGGKFKLSFGNVSIDQARVLTLDGATLQRNIYNFNNSRIKFRANLQDIAPEFTRIADISDPDRYTLIADRGYKQSEYKLDFKPTKRLRLESYINDANNPTSKKIRTQHKHELSYAFSKDMGITYLTDDNFATAKKNVLSGYSHNKLTFDNKVNVLGGILFSGLNDVNTTVNNKGVPTTVHTIQTRVETNPSAKTSYSLESIRCDLDRGHFENTIAVGTKTKATKTLGVYTTIDRTSMDQGMSNLNASYGIDWTVNKNLTMKAGILNRDSGPLGHKRSSTFSMNGLVTNRFLLLNDIKAQSGMNTTELTGKQSVCNNSMRIDAGLMKGTIVLDNSDRLNPINDVYYTSRVLQFDTDKDPKKWYHFSYFRQHYITIYTTPATTRNMTADFRLSPKIGLTLSRSHGLVVPEFLMYEMSGANYKLKYNLSPNSSLFADYSMDVNEMLLRRTRIAGVGWTGTISNKAAVELYFGSGRLFETSKDDIDNVFRIKYDHKMSVTHYISLSAQKRSAIDQLLINPDYGDTTANLDLNIQFH